MRLSTIRITKLKGCEYKTYSPFLLPEEYICTDKTLDVGGFFSGLIDEVRIYKRVITP